MPRHTGTVGYPRCAVVCGTVYNVNKYWFQKKRSMAPRIK